MRTNANFRVIHLSTAHIGGAGISARRLNDALVDAGYNSNFIAISHSTYNTSKNELAVERSLIKKSIGKAFVIYQDLFKSRTYFTLGSSSALRISDFNQYDPNTTILHIHNWFNLANMRLFRQLLVKGFKVVFTLHDMRLITGGCHYSLDCTNYLENCKGCPMLPVYLRAIPPRNLLKMRELLKEFEESITLICPSQWLANLATKSKILPADKIHFIPNVHQNDRISHYGIQQTSRNQNHKMQVGIASLDISSPLKGGDVLHKLMSQATELNCGLEFLFLSDYDSKGLDQELFWRDIDYLLVLSRADNSPNVIHEAKNRQIPIIATQVGGITELTNPEIDVAIDESMLEVRVLLSILEDKAKSLAEYRPRMLDSHYRNYVNGALQKTISVYEKVALTN